MPYVTLFNESRIIEKARTEINRDLSYIDIYHNTMYFWNDLELSQLHDYKRFCEGDIDVDNNYKKAKVIDKKKFIHEGQLPSYHLYKDCERLNSRFRNIELPKEVQSWKDGELEEFRNWFKKNIVNEQDAMEIEQKILEEWGIRYSVKRVNYKNSGSIFKEYLDLSQLEKRIDSLIIAQKYFYIQNKKIFKNVSTRASYLGFNKNVIDNNTELSDEDLKELLRYYHNLFKEPLIHYFREYFQVKFSKEIEFSGDLLESLGFKACTSCHNNIKSVLAVKPSEDNTELDLTELDVFLKAKGAKKVDRNPTSLSFNDDIDDNYFKINYGFRKLVAFSNPTNKTDKVVVEFIIGDKIFYFEADYYGLDLDTPLSDLELYDGYLVETKIEKENNKILFMKVFPFSMSSKSNYY